MKNLFYKVLRLLGIRTHRSFRLVLRAGALLVGSYAAFEASVLLQKNDFDKAWCFYLIVLVAAFIEFILADVFADRSFPFDTERKLVLMEKRLGIQVIETRIQVASA